LRPSRPLSIAIFASFFQLSRHYGYADYFQELSPSDDFRHISIDIRSRIFSASAFISFRAGFSDIRFSPHVQLSADASLADAGFDMTEGFSEGCQLLVEGPPASLAYFRHAERLSALADADRAERKAADSG